MGAQLSVSAEVVRPSVLLFLLSVCSLYFLLGIYVFLLIYTTVTIFSVLVVLFLGRSLLPSPSGVVKISSHFHQLYFSILGAPDSWALGKHTHTHGDTIGPNISLSLSLCSVTLTNTNTNTNTCTLNNSNHDPDFTFPSLNPRRKGALEKMTRGSRFLLSV